VVASGQGWLLYQPAAPLRTPLDLVMASDAAYVAGGTQRPTQACAWKGCLKRGCKQGAQGGCQRCGNNLSFPADLKAALRGVCEPTLQLQFA